MKQSTVSTVTTANPLSIILYCHWGLVLRENGDDVTERFAVLRTVLPAVGH